jgi:NAD(P)-dependent dehydrogenase (short-subunit alcohol dehydrogenase family)
MGERLRDKVALVVGAGSVGPGWGNGKAAAVAAYGGSADELVRRRDQQCPMGHMGDAWDIAHAALFLASEEARYITGTELVVDGGLSVNCV